jgi:hypothetical protein
VSFCPLKVRERNSKKDIEKMVFNMSLYYLPIKIIGRSVKCDLFRLLVVFNR